VPRTVLTALKSSRRNSAAPVSSHTSTQVDLCHRTNEIHRLHSAPQLGRAARIRKRNVYSPLQDATEKVIAGTGCQAGAPNVMPRTPGESK